MCSMRSIFLVLLGASYALAQQNILAIECPVPGNPDTASVLQCAKYSACQYTNGTCHMKKNDVAGYVVSSDPVDTGTGFMVTLDKADSSVTMFGADINQLVFEVMYHEDYHLHIKIYDPNDDRYEVPYPLNLPTNGTTSPMYSVWVSPLGSPFHFNITRISTGTVIMRAVGPLTYEDQFIQFTQVLPSDYLYGIGENPHTKLRHTFSPRQTYPIFARDQPTTTKNVNQYGSHPYFINVEDDSGNTHSVLFHNSNAMEFSTFLLTDGSPTVTTRTIGGIVDMHIFLGPTPEDVNVQYADTVGKPIFPPYWLFGFILSRFGYGSTANYRVVRDRMKADGIPQDVQVFDIDYMDQYKDFTYDPVNWGDFPDLIQELHDDNVRVILIFDPALEADFDSYPPAQRGRDSDVFIKWNSPDLVPEDQPAGADDYIVGYVWPENKTVFPDFFNPSTAAWWADEFTRFHTELNFDGVWIDMNEPSNFGTNLDAPWNWPAGEPDWSLKCPNNSLDSPPYGTLAAYSSESESQRISDKTICMSTVQSNGTANFSHYDVHNLFGLSETIASYEALEVFFPGLRHVILSRSTFVGSGRYAVHWLGDNTASWEQLKMSLIGMMEFNMFAIPMVGADVCGFFGEPSEELCIRWMQAGAFYPFDRNHNTNGTADQDPANPDWSLAPGISRDVLMLRYQYIPYMYARFHRAHMNGFSVIRPLFNVFPSDLVTRDIDDQFMWSTDLMVAPVVTRGAVTRDVYFPDSLWYDLVSGELVAQGPLTLTVDAPLEKIPVYVRGGSILPYQEPATTTTVSRGNPFGLTVALDTALTAAGEVFWDSGVIDHSMEETFIGELTFVTDTLELVPQYDPTPADGVMLQTVMIYGFPASPTSVDINDQAAPPTSYVYDVATQVLILNLDIPINTAFTIVFNYTNIV